ncbi:MAG: hypothetical protein AMXMBFR47_13740 [Planctomycetota bacterium]
MNAVQRSSSPGDNLDAKARDAVAATMGLREAEADALIAVDAVAKLCDCSPRHIYRLSAEGLMPRSVRLGKTARWRRSEIQRWIAAGCPASGGAK